jgi:integrase
MCIVVKHTKKHSSGRVEYRRAYPPELRRFVPRPDGKGGEGPREFKRSFGLEGSPGFLSRYEAAAGEYDATVHRARRELDGAYDPLDAPAIAYLAELFRVRELERDERERWRRGEDHAARLEAALEWELDDFRRWAAEGDREAVGERWGAMARELLTEAGRVVDPNDWKGFGRLCAAINAAAIGLREPLKARLRGEVVTTPSRPAPPSEAPIAAPAGPRVPIMPTFEAYAAEAGMTAGVRSEWRKYFERLVAFLGHDDAAQLRADDVIRWKDQLLAEPTRAGGKRSPVTVNDKYLTSLKAMLGWAVDQRKLPDNVAKGIRARVPKQAKLRDRDFTADEARRILAASLEPASPRMAEGHRRARRWIPWLCAYTGARVNEMSQLRGEDVFELEGVPVLRITPEAGTTKTREARVVPLHPHLIEQGFLSVVVANGPGPLFYDPRRQRVAGEGSRHFKKVGERLAEWVRKEVGVDDPGIMPNHAWRHTFKTRAIAAAVPEKVSDAITGHAPTTVSRAYGTVPLETKAEAVRSLPRFDVQRTNSKVRA